MEQILNSKTGFFVSNIEVISQPEWWYKQLWRSGDCWNSERWLPPGGQTGNYSRSLLMNWCCRDRVCAQDQWGMLKWNNDWFDFNTAPQTKQIGLNSALKEEIIHVTQLQITCSTFDRRSSWEDPSHSVLICPTFVIFSFVVLYVPSVWCNYWAAGGAVVSEQTISPNSRCVKSVTNQTKCILYKRKRKNKSSFWHEGQKVRLEEGI